MTVPGAVLVLAMALAPAQAPPAPAGPLPGLPEPGEAGASALAARPRLPLPSAADRAALQAVYEQPALRRARANPEGLRRLLAVLWGRLVELLAGAEAERYAGVGRTVFLCAVLVAALAGLAAARRRRLRAPPPRRASSGQPAALPPPDRSAALAEAALARGDRAGAVRFSFLSALAALEKAGSVPRDRTLTNHELSGRLRAAAAPCREDFRELARTFGRTVYGGHDPGPEEAAASVARATRLRAGAGGDA